MRVWSVSIATERGKGAVIHLSPLEAKRLKERHLPTWREASPVALAALCATTRHQLSSGLYRLGSVMVATSLQSVWGGSAQFAVEWRGEAEVLALL